MDTAEKSKMISEYKAKLREMPLEELKALEEQLIKEADDNDKRVNELEFDLSGDNFKNVALAIRAILNKKEVEWQFTLGLVAMYDFWNPDEKPAKISYPMLDATLRTLGEGRFKGYEEWAAVIVVNKYFESLRNEYVDTTETIYDIAAKHNAVLDELKLKDPAFNEEAAVKIS